MITHYKVTRDCLFKYIFGNPKNTGILISLVNAVLKDSDQPEITSATIENPFNIKEFEDGKESVIDIRAKDVTGKVFNIEMQSQSDPLFGYRSLYYWAKLYSNQMKTGQGYSRLNPVICINILDFNLFKDTNKAHICFVIREKESHLE
ncbi:MAG: Rpn family recombination-promoting nuclease/putative transposase, partial [Spirochaetales bacterium]|nr:Rpn family recombination-promoting nuclease/putative transposase [Spirochaetales bacterium]